MNGNIVWYDTPELKGWYFVTDEGFAFGDGTKKMAQEMRIDFEEE